MDQGLPANTAEASSVAEQLGQRRLALEFERVKFERQKASIEMRLKRRELSITAKKGWDFLGNPLSLAIVGGFITLMTTTIASHVSTSDSIKAEAAKARQALQADLIKKFVENPTPQAVRTNLKFLVDVGLVPDYANGLRSFLKTTPDSALPSLSRGKCGKFKITGVPSEQVDSVIEAFKTDIPGPKDIARERSPDGTYSITADYGPCG